MPEILIYIPCLGAILVCVLLVYAVMRAAKHNEAANALAREIGLQAGTVFTLHPWDGKWQRVQINDAVTAWKPFIVALRQTELALYHRSPPRIDLWLAMPLSDLRWFGRPQPYHSDINEIWLHFEHAGRWSIVKIRMGPTHMREFVRALKLVVPSELVSAYRRRRPYIHAGPVLAYPAHQDIHGAWSLEAPLHLYLMPLFLVVLDQASVLRKIPLEQVQQVGSLRRLDQPDAHGLVRFQIEGETMAFALDGYEVFAAQLAEAAKRTLEEPVLQKQKKKDDEDEDW